MRRRDNRLILILTMLGVFVGWLALVAFWFVPLITSEKLDPMISIISALGVGGVTQAFIVLITLSWQFYFRKKEPQEDK